MTDDKLYTSLSANTIMAKVTNHFQRTKLITSSTDKHYSLDSEDDFRSGCRNVSHQQQFFSELHSPGRSYYTNYWYSWVQTIYYVTVWFVFNPNPREGQVIAVLSARLGRIWQGSHQMTSSRYVAVEGWFIHGCHGNRLSRQKRHAKTLTHSRVEQ